MPFLVVKRSVHLDQPLCRRVTLARLYSAEWQQTIQENRRGENGLNYLNQSDHSLNSLTPMTCADF